MIRPKLILVLSLVGLCFNLFGGVGGGEDPVLKKRVKRMVNFHLWKGKCILVDRIELNHAEKNYEVLVQIKEKDKIRYNRYILGQALRPTKDTFEFIGTYDKPTTIPESDDVQDS